MIFLDARPRQIFLVLLLLALHGTTFAACLSPAAEPQTISANDGGIGGTGMVAEGGIGGTGIVGTITGFASVCINGLEVEFDESTTVRSNHETSGLQQLAIGQVIAINAVNDTHGLRAEKIDILNAVEGRISMINLARSTLQVLGQTILITPATQFTGITKINDMTLDMPIKISGYRNAENAIVATRIALTIGLQTSSVIGVVEQADDGQYRIAGLVLAGETASLAVGSESLLSGSFDGQLLHISRVQNNPSVPFANTAQRVVIEGLLLAEPGAQQLKISGFEIDYTGLRTAATKLEIGQMLRVTGQLTAGRHIKAQHLQLMPHLLPAMTSNHNMAERMQHRDTMTRPMTMTRPNTPMPQNMPMMRR